MWFLTASTNAVLRLLGIDPNAEEETVSEEEIRMMVDVGNQKGTIDHEEKQFIQNVFEFDGLTAGEIATHRTDLTILWLEESMESGPPPSTTAATPGILCAENPRTMWWVSSMQKITSA